MNQEVQKSQAPAQAPSNASPAVPALLSLFPQTRPAMADCHPSSSGSPSREEARRLFDDYETLGDDSALENQKSLKSDKPTPIPMAQLATLCTVRLVDPIVFTQIFPYVNEMMEHLHVTEDRSKIGFYSGLVVSDVAAAQLGRCLGLTLNIRPIVAGEQLRRGSGHINIPVGEAVWYVCRRVPMHSTLE